MRRIALMLAALLVVLALPIPASGAGVSFSARLSAENEVPPAPSDAFGMAKFKLNADGSVSFKLMGHKLSGPALAAHIHFSADEAHTAPARVTLCGGGPPPAAVETCTTTAKGKLKIQGTIAAESTSDDLFAAIAAGLAYVNVHTADNTGGEMRGQLAG
jgi:hypothetical protein